jgi:uncharacterized protein (TIGR03083 family)
LNNADTNIAALRTGHERLTARVATFSDADLVRPSGAEEWSISQVLSHLGSGAEIGRAIVRASLDGAPPPDSDFNKSVWSRWDAMSPRQHADGFPASNAALVELYESLDADTRANLRIDVGYLPAPVDVAHSARLRLSEFTLHTWDVEVGFDEHATLAPEATGLLLKGTNEVLGWLGKADRLDGTHAVIEVTTTEPASVFALRLGESVGVDSTAPEHPDGTLSLPAEAWLRLVTGRLKARHTPDAVTTSGAADLDLLRRVFPGY